MTCRYCRPTKEKAFVPSPSELARQEESEPLEKGDETSVPCNPECCSVPQPPTYEDLQSALQSVTTFEAVRGQMLLEAQESLRTVQAHANAALNKYRAQEELVARLEGIILGPSDKTVVELFLEVARVLRDRR